MFRRASVRVQDAGGGPRQARRHAQLLGRRHGTTQFLPSECYKYAVDFDGDGKGHLELGAGCAGVGGGTAGRQGWRPGMRWAYEVRTPRDVDCTIGVPEVTQPVSEWLQRGYVPAQGLRPSLTEMSTPASLLLPEGTYGPAFLTLKNYYVIKDYNFSDLSVLFVGHLSERISDPRGFETPWSKGTQLKTPMSDHAADAYTRVSTGQIDGKAGMRARRSAPIRRPIGSRSLWPRPRCSGTCSKYRN
jgi:hypothetical protein